MARSSATKPEKMKNDFTEATAKVQELSPGAGSKGTMATAREVFQAGGTNLVSVLEVHVGVR